MSLSVSRVCWSVVLIAVGVAANAADDSPSQVRRLTEAQYRASIADIFGDDIKVTGRFEPDLRIDGLMAAGSTQVSITPGGFEHYLSIAQGIAAQVTDESHRARLIGCTPDDNDVGGERCAKAFFKRIGLRINRRPLSDAQLQVALVTAHDAAQRLGDFHAGMAAALTGMLTSPEFLFQIDRTVADRKRRDARMLDDWSMASRLSYFLWNTTPDDELRRAADRGELHTADGLHRQVERLIAAPRFADGVRAFFSDYLRLDDINTLTKDPVIYPAFSSKVAADAREQTLRTIVDLLVTQRGDYRDLFTTRRMAMNRTLGTLYRVPVNSQGWTTYEFPANDPRVGILTQIAFLSLADASNHPGRPSATLRGKALREIFLCQKLPSPPANVNFAIVQDTSNPKLRTARERVRAHLDDEDCAGCHRAMDAIGLTFENFDGASQFRLRENGQLIDASGMLDNVKFDGPAGLAQAMHDHPGVPGCAVRSIYRYGVGRNLASGDDAAVAEFDRSFAASGYRITDLMKAIATSRFFYGFDAPAPVTTTSNVAAKPTRNGGNE